MNRDDLAAEWLTTIRSWANSSARSQQTEIGWSEVGDDDCATWRTLHAGPTTNPDAKVLASVRGTAVHSLLEPLLRSHGWQTEVEVEWGGVVGHVDAYRDGIVLDLKTGDEDKANALRRYGPERNHRWQVQGYARALAEKGHPVTKVCILMVATDTSDAVAVWEDDYRPEIADEALAHVAELAEQSIPPRPGRDPSWCADWCRHFDADGSKGGCPSWGIRDRVEIEDEGYRQAARDVYELADLAKRKSAAKARLEGVEGTVDDLTVRRASRKGSSSLDIDAMDLAAYEALIGEVPYRASAGSSWVEVKRSRKAKP